jgi:hypothetical protein
MWPPEWLDAGAKTWADGFNPETDIQFHPKLVDQGTE